MRRTVIPELLDSDGGTPQEIAASLADLRVVNRWFGGIATTRSMVERVSSRRDGYIAPANAGNGGRRLSLLDVGSGSGDIPLEVARQLQTGDIHAQIILLDRSPLHFSQPDFSQPDFSPPDFSQPDASHPDLPRPGPLHRNAGDAHRVIADAMALPFRDGSVDLVSCALLAHHLEPDEVVRFVNEALRVARIAVLINDLRRSWTHLAAVYAGFLFYRSRLTRHDAPASVRRAYTPREFASILRSTGAQKVEIYNHYLFRMGAIAWKKPATT